MRALVQRVSEASVSVDGTVVGAIGSGACVLVGVRRGDGPDDARTLARKVAHLRIFGPATGERSLLDEGGGCLVVSQFTLHADTGKGRRPSFGAAAPPEEAEPLVELMATEIEAAGISVARGVFGATMQVMLTNDGPCTILLDTASG